MLRHGATILAMLCEEGQKLKDFLADASIRFSDYPAADVKQMPVPDRLQAEKHHLEQQEASPCFHAACRNVLGLWPAKKLGTAV